MLHVNHETILFGLVLKTLEKLENQSILRRKRRVHRQTTTPDTVVCAVLDASIFILSKLLSLNLTLLRKGMIKYNLISPV